MLTAAAEQFGQDLRHGMRALRRGRGAAAMAVFTLALGIGANTAIFSVSYAYLLRVWQVREPEHLAFVRARSTDGERIDDFAWPTVEQLRLATRSFSTISAFDGSTIAVTVDGQPEMLHGDFVTGDYFSLLDLQTTLGRPLTRDDDLPGRPPVAVISHAYWRQRFGADPHVIGKTVVLKDLVCAIVGVASQTYTGRGTAGDGPAVMVPMVWHAALGLKDHTTFELLGRLREGATREAARTELDAIYQRARAEEQARELAQQQASGGAIDTSHPSMQAHIELQSALHGSFDDERFSREMWILQLVAGLVLVLATVNVASLQLARGAGRQRELATRLALGATRPRLIRLLLAESLLLSAAGGVAGLGLALWVADALLTLILGRVPLSSTVLQGPIVVFTVALMLVAAILSGIVPAVRLTRADQTTGVSTSLRTRSDDHRRRTGQSLIVVQIALSIVLLIPAGLLIRTVDRLARVDLGFDPNRLLLLSIYPTLAGYEGPRELHLYDEILNRLNAVPGIEVASFSRFTVLQHGRSHGLTIHGDREIVDPSVAYVLDAAAPRLFAALGLQLRAGRDFSSADTITSPRVVIVNQALADRYFANGDAVGRSLDVEGSRRQIVGVVGNMLFTPRDERPSPAVYLVYTQAPQDMLGQMFMKIRTTGDPLSMMPAIRHELQQAASNLAPVRPITMAATIADDRGAEASLAKLVSIAGGLALFLAMVGLYGSMTQTVSRRTREIGVRVALGARPREVSGMILREVGLLVLVGVAIGVPAAWAAGGLVNSFLFGVSPANPLTTIACCALVTAICAAAAYAPAHRAAHIDPVIALQQD